MSRTKAPAAAVYETGALDTRRTKYSARFSHHMGEHRFYHELPAKRDSSTYLAQFLLVLLGRPRLRVLLARVREAAVAELACHIGAAQRLVNGVLRGDGIVVGVDSGGGTAFRLIFGRHEHATEALHVQHGVAGARFGRDIGGCLNQGGDGAGAVIESG